MANSRTLIWFADMSALPVFNKIHGVIACTQYALTQLDRYFNRMECVPQEEAASGNRIGTAT